MLNKLITDICTYRKHYRIAKELNCNKLEYCYFLFDEKRVATGKDQKFLEDSDKCKVTRLVLVGNALAMMKSAAVNLIFLEKLANYQGHIPGKIFEYIAVQRPVLGAGDPEGDTAKIIRQSGCGNVYAAATNWHKIINDAYAGWQNQKEPKIDLEYINQFHRRQLTAKLAEFFGEIL